MAGKTNQKILVDWKFIIALFALVISFFGFFYGTGQCQSANPPPWLIPALNILCSQRTVPVT